MPLVNAVPGLQRAETGRLVAALDGGEQAYYRVAELYFAEQAALEAAFASDQGESSRSRLSGNRPAWIEDVRRSHRRLTATPWLSRQAGYALFLYLRIRFA